MFKSGHRLYTVTLLLAAFAVATACLASPVWAAQSGGASQVRMAVDPTVLPPVLPPDAVGEPETAPSPDIETAAQDIPTPQVEEGASQQAAAPDTATPEPDSAAPKAEKPQSEGGHVQEITLESTDNSVTLTLACDGPVGDVTHFSLDEPDRLVVDVRQRLTFAGDNVFRAAQGPIRHVVVGEHPDRFRMVFHWNIPPEQEVVPTISRHGNNLVLQLKMP